MVLFLSSSFIRTLWRDNPNKSFASTATNHLSCVSAPDLVIKLGRIQSRVNEPRHCVRHYPHVPVIVHRQVTRVDHVLVVAEEHVMGERIEPPAGVPATDGVPAHFRIEDNACLWVVAMHRRLAHLLTAAQQLKVIPVIRAGCLGAVPQHFCGHGKLVQRGHGVEHGHTISSIHLPRGQCDGEDAVPPLVPLSSYVEVALQWIDVEVRVGERPHAIFGQAIDVEARIEKVGNVGEGRAAVPRLRVNGEAGQTDSRGDDRGGDLVAMNSFARRQVHDPNGGLLHLQIVAVLQEARVDEPEAVADVVDTGAIHGDDAVWTGEVTRFKRLKDRRRKETRVYNSVLIELICCCCFQ